MIKLTYIKGEIERYYPNIDFYSNFILFEELYYPYPCRDILYQI